MTGLAGDNYKYCKAQRSIKATNVLLITEELSVNKYKWRNF